MAALSGTLVVDRSAFIAHWYPAGAGPGIAYYDALLSLLVSYRLLPLASEWAFPPWP